MDSAREAIALRARQLSWHTRRRVARVLGWIRALPWAELATGLVVLVAWGCLTAAAVRLTPAAHRATTLLIAVGLLAAALAGLKFLGVLAWHGLYTLTRNGEGDRRA